MNINKIKYNTPKTITKYIIKEFSLSLIIFLSIFLTLIITTGLIEEIIFLKEKIETNKIYTEAIVLTLLKAPSMIIILSPFIFLFSGIFFFVKLIKKNELTPLKLSGLSNFFIVSIPSVYCFLIGIFLVSLVSPFSSNMSKFYETIKHKYRDDKNLIIFNNTGIWIKEKKLNQTLILRADLESKIDEGMLKNTTAYFFDKKNDLIERIDSDEGKIIKNKILFFKGIKSNNITTKKDDVFEIATSINIKKLNKVYNDPNVFSIWNINNEINLLRKSGYYGQELVIKFNKYLSLPFFLFSMISISAIVVLRQTRTYNNFVYTFFAIFIGIILYFLTDTSIALGKTGRIPLVLSVWFPIIVIMIISIYSLTEKK